MPMSRNSGPPLLPSSAVTSTDSSNPVASATGRAAPALGPPDFGTAVAVDLSWLLPPAVAQHEVPSCRYRGTNRTTGNVV
jgi:hypothetical protein